MRKGIILSGGLGTRLYPCTRVISKQLLPVYDKPLVYYPISTLMMANIRDIMIITSPADRAPFENLIGDGSQWGLKICYATQLEPKGIAECFRIAEKWIGEDDVTLILGDNIFYGNELINRFNRAASNHKGSTLFAYHVADPERFGVIEQDSSGNPIKIIEKPKVAPSNYAVTGLYFYDNKVVDYAWQIQPSAVVAVSVCQKPLLVLVVISSLVLASASNELENNCVPDQVFDPSKSGIVFPDVPVFFPSSKSAFKLVTNVVEETVNGAVPVA